MELMGITIDKVFINKNYSSAFSMGSKLKIWFNNLSFSDYVFLDKMGSDVYSDCGLDGILKSPKDYKKNILFINNNSETEPSPAVNLYVGSFVATLEKDRCLISFDKRHHIIYEHYEHILDIVVKKETRKQKINSLLHDN